MSGGARLVLLVGLLATFATRFVLLPELPVGLNFDEGFYGLDALSVLQGNVVPFYPQNGGRESLFMVLVAPFILIFGRDPLALRVTAAGLGVLTVAATFPLGRRLFRSSLPEAAEWIGLATFALSAGSLWFILYHRIGLRINAFPFAMAVAGYWFWRAYETRSSWLWAMAALGFGLVQYTYTAARVVPAIIPGFVGVRAIVGWNFRELWVRKREWLVFAAIAVLAVSPLALYGLTHPDDFFRRQAAISPLNEAKNPEPPAVRIGKSLLATMPMFFVEGDQRIYRNLPGKPVFDPWIAPFFLLGIGLSLRRIKTPAYLFILLWFSVLVVASAVPLGVVPHNSHAIGELPIVYVFPALGLVEAARWAAKRAPARAIVAAAAALILLTAAVSIKQYFVDWRALDSGFQFDSDVAEIAGTMNDSGNQPDLAYVIEISRLYPPTYIHGTINFLYTGSAPFTYLRVDEDSVAANLASAVGSKHKVIKFERSIERDVPADNQEIADFLLRRQGAKESEVDRNGYRFTTYRVDEALWPSLAPTGWKSGPPGDIEHVKLNRWSAGLSSSLGAVWAIGDWSSPRRDTDIKASIRLKDSAGKLVSLADRDFLAPPFFETASRWEGTQNVLTYHLLQLPPGLAPGDYRLSAVLYETESGKLLGEPAGSVLDLGSISIPERRITQDDLDPEVLLPEPADQRRAGGLTLVGREIASDDLQPGQPIELTLFWQADQSSPRPGPVTVRAIDGSGRIAGAWSGEVGGAYPTNRWQAGTLVRDSVSVDLNLGAPTGTYRVEALWSRLAPVFLGEVDITSRNHAFTVPQVGTGVNIPAGDFGRLARWEGSIDPAGKLVSVTLYWVDAKPADRSWTVFVHLVDDEGRILAQSDTVPAAGAAPTQSWMANEVIADTHRIAIQNRGTFRVRVGMYDPKTNERVAFGSQDFADLGQIG